MGGKSPEEQEIFKTLLDGINQIQETREDLKEIFQELTSQLKGAISRGDTSVNGISLTDAFIMLSNLSKSIGDADNSIAKFVSEEVKAAKDHYARVKEAKEGENDFSNLDFSSFGDDKN